MTWTAPVWGQYRGKGAAGWTVIVPSEAASSPSAKTSTVVFVSQTDGHDNNNGLSHVPNPSNTGGAGAAGPKKTIASAVALMASGDPDWLLFKKGDTFSDQCIGTTGNLQRSGYSADEPMVFSSYDLDGGGNPLYPDPITSNARPIIAYSQASGGAHVVGSLGGGESAYLLFMGLDFYNYKRDPNNVSYSPTSTDLKQASNGTRFLKVTHDLRFENCRFRFFTENIGISPGGVQADNSNVTIHRCTSVDSIDLTNFGSSRPQGIYAQQFPTHNPPNLVIQESVFDHNGWNSDMEGPVSVSITQASPAVVTWTGNKMTQTATSVGDVVYFASTGGGITAGSATNQQGGSGVTPVSSTYYVYNNDGNTFNLSIYYPTHTKTGTLNGTTVVTGLPSTSDIAAGMTVSGTNIVGGTLIASIDSSTQITLDTAATGSGSVSLLFTTQPANYLNTTAGLVSPQNCRWRQAGPNELNHNLYLATDAVARIRGNFISRDGSGCQHRGGGIIEDNLSLMNPYAHNMGCPYTGQRTVVQNNVYIESVDPSNSFATIGGEGPSTTGSSNGIIVYDHNLHCNENGSGGFGMLMGSGFDDGFITNNIWFNWDGTLIRDLASNTTKTNNQQDGAGSNNNPSGLAPAEPFPDPSRSTGSYAATIGLAGTATALINAARENCKDNWDDRLTAPRINDYLRQGFGYKTATIGMVG